MAASNTFITGVLRVNGFKIGKPRKDGSFTCEKVVVNLGGRGTFTVAVESPADGNPTVSVTRRGDEKPLLVKTDDWSEIGSDAVAFAHTLAG